MQIVVYGCCLALNVRCNEKIWLEEGSATHGSGATNDSLDDPQWLLTLAKNDKESTNVSKYKYQMPV